MSKTKRRWDHERVARWAAAKNVTDIDIAAALGCSVTAARYWLDGSSVPGVVYAADLCRLLGKRVEDAMVRS